MRFIIVTFDQDLIITYLDDVKSFMKGFSTEVPNPYENGSLMTLNRLQELVGQENGINIYQSEGTVSLRLVDNNRPTPDLNFVLIEKNGEQYVDLISTVCNCYDENWMPDRKMKPKIKWFIAKAFR